MDDTERAFVSGSDYLRVETVHNVHAGVVGTAWLESEAKMDIETYQELLSVQYLGSGRAPNKFVTREPRAKPQQYDDVTRARQSVAWRVLGCVQLKPFVGTRASDCWSGMRGFCCCGGFCSGEDRHDTLGSWEEVVCAFQS